MNVINSELTNKTKIAAYFIWDITKKDDVLRLWNCAEDIACFFEQYHIDSTEKVREILAKGPDDIGYTMFIRHVAYRIYLYTGCESDTFNWFVAEKLLTNREWTDAVTRVAVMFRKLGATQAKSDHIRNFYRRIQD